MSEIIRWLEQEGVNLFFPVSILLGLIIACLCPRKVVGITEKKEEDGTTTEYRHCKL